MAFEVDVPVLGKASYTLRVPVRAGRHRHLVGLDRGARRRARDPRRVPPGRAEPDVTEVTYRLAVELGPLVPGFLRTEGAKRVIENALERLKRRVEMG